jgi:hypothetical protein
MLDTFKSLPEDPTELRAVSKLMAAEIQSQAYQIEKLKGQLAFAIVLEPMAHKGSSSKSPLRFQIRDP